MQNAISQTSPLIIGHRGASALAPENTLAAFARAFDDGAHGIELDVRLARDGVPVVIHDATLRRTGLMSGEVGQMTSIELSKINVGKWFNRAHPALARAAYENECVPTLAAVFRFLFDRPGIFYVELKTDRTGSTYDLVRSVNSLIGQFSLQSRVVVVSFDHAALAWAKSLTPSPCTGALFELRRSANPGWRSDTMLNTAAECGADEILPHHLLARPKLIENARIKNLSVVVWTADEPRRLARAKALGIHGLITNNPARLLLA